MKAVLLFLLIGLALDTASAQTAVYRYDTDYIDAGFYQRKRAELRGKLADSSMAILFAAPVRNRSNDVDFPYQQSSDFYYLTGFTEPNAVLLLFSKPYFIDGDSVKEALFIPARKKAVEIWTGIMPSTDDAKSISGIMKVLTTDKFSDALINPGSFSKIYYLNLPYGMKDEKNNPHDLFNLVERFRTMVTYPPPNGDSFLLRKMLSSMREVKEPEEMALLRKAIDITCKGHIEMMKRVKPGMYEYQVEAVGEHSFFDQGAEAVGYPSICGGGPNANILHYTSNRRKLISGDLILLDMGAEYHGYTADVTRTLPVNGKFSTEQRIIYDLVKETMDSALAQCSPGKAFNDPHKAAVSVISRGLMELGILKADEGYNQYFMHGTSHYLGLDVHDVGSHGPLKPGNVITIEPGIYIAEGSPCDPKWWNIGIRIEDDVLITKDGHENLSVSCPSKADEIEQIIKRGSTNSPAINR